MVATLNKITDRRTPLQKYTRKELQYMAQVEGREDIDPAMPADLMRRKFMEHPPAMWPRPMSGTLGMHFDLKIPPFDKWRQIAYGQSPTSTEPKEDEVRQATVEDDLAAQWEAQQKPVLDYSEMPFYQLKKECKRMGIPFKRTDKKKDLLEKLTGG